MLNLDTHVVVYMFSGELTAHEEALLANNLHTWEDVRRATKSLRRPASYTALRW